jgi:DNA-binding response OmpR family regulator
MPARTTTLVVADDDPQVLRLVTRNLQMAGYTVIEAHNGQQALEQIQETSPDLVLLDVLMPRLDGFAVIQAVRSFSTVPIILVSARTLDADKLRGFELGADDYLTKPFSVDELLGRVRAVLRRSQQSSDGLWDHATGALRVTLGALELDFAQQRVTWAGREIDLTAIEYRLLATLATNAGRIVTREQLLERVWGPAYVGERHRLQVNINRLRHKIELDLDQPRYLVTKLGIGYRLATPPAA